MIACLSFHSWDPCVGLICSMTICCCFLLLISCAVAVNCRSGYVYEGKDGGCGVGMEACSHL
jgi:hypothetical protein